MISNSTNLELFKALLRFQKLSFIKQYIPKTTEIANYLTQYIKIHIDHLTQDELDMIGRVEDKKDNELVNKLTTQFIKDRNSKMNYELFMNLWMWFRKYDAEALEMYDNVGHLEVNYDYVEKYNPFFEQALRPNFIRLMTLKSGEIKICSNDPTDLCISIVKHENEFSIIWFKIILQNETSVGNILKIAEEKQYYGKAWILEVNEYISI